MDLLKSKILDEGIVIGTQVLKVDSFLNHQIDPNLMNEIGREFAKRFSDKKITKILTIEASGIAPAIFAGKEMNIPVVFAKKTTSLNLDSETYTARVHSFTKEIDYIVRVSKKFITPGDCVLVIDDFLANGQAIIGLSEIIEQAGAKLVGAGVVIEKGFQDGGALLREMGIRVESLAIIDKMSEKQITFRKIEEEKKK